MARQFLYGFNPVVAALTARRRTFQKLMVAPPYEEKASLFALAKNVVRTENVSRETIERFATNKPHQGIVLEASPLPVTAISHDSMDNLPTDKVILCLDHITDPQNFGAILRSACFLGLTSVVTTKKHSCPITPAVSKVSSGAVEYMRVLEVGNLPLLLRNLRTKGYAVVATGQGTSLNEWKKSRDNSQKAVLVLGSEGEGVRPQVEAECSACIFIPGGRDTIDSLNVSCAATVLLHSLIH